jgi:hypothetical protein
LIGKGKSNDWKRKREKGAGDERVLFLPDTKYTYLLEYLQELMHKK